MAYFKMETPYHVINAYLKHRDFCVPQNKIGKATIPLHRCKNNGKTVLGKVKVFGCKKDFLDFINDNRNIVDDLRLPDDDAVSSNHLINDEEVLDDKETF